MFRLIGLLIVIAALGLMSVVALDGLSGAGKSGKDCPGGTTTTMAVSIAPGLAKLIDGC